MTQSATAARVLATGRASPAKPPMAAPTPVGTIRTDVYGLLKHGDRASADGEKERARVRWRGAAACAGVKRAARNGGEKGRTIASPVPGTKGGEARAGNEAD
jgi:hypothetical protein